MKYVLTWALESFTSPLWIHEELNHVRASSEAEKTGENSNINHFPIVINNLFDGNAISNLTIVFRIYVSIVAQIKHS